MVNIISIYILFGDFSVYIYIYIYIYILGMSSSQLT